MTEGVLVGPSFLVKAWFEATRPLTYNSQLKGNYNQMLHSKWKMYPNSDYSFIEIEDGSVGKDSDSLKGSIQNQE